MVKKYLFRPYVLIILGYTVFLVLLPFIQSIITPCISSNQQGNYLLANCNMQLATARLSYLVVLGMTISFFAGVFYTKRGNGFFGRLAILALILVFMSVVGFYANLPYTIFKIQTAPVELTAPEGLENVELRL